MTVESGMIEQETGSFLEQIFRSGTVLRKRTCAKTQYHVSCFEGQSRGQQRTR